MNFVNYFQDIIRSSISHVESPSLVISKPSSQSLPIKLPSQPATILPDSHQLSSTVEIPADNDDDDYDDDWDTFQSLPADDGLKDDQRSRTAGGNEGEDHTVHCGPPISDDDDGNCESFQSLPGVSDSEVAKPLSASSLLETERTGDKYGEEDQSSHASPLVNDDNDDDNNWETFQSLPVTDSSNEVIDQADSPTGLHREIQPSITSDDNKDQDHGLR